jgi:hypothetical protein
MDTFEYIKTLARFRDEFGDDKPSWIRITTITMMARDLLGPVDAKKVRKLFREPILVVPKGSKKGFEWKLKPAKRGSNFYNCVSIGYTDCYSTKAVKLFSNGSVQVAGCSNVLDCKRIVAQLAVLLPLILNKSININFSLFKIVMINTNFSVNKTLNLYKLKRVLENDSKFEVIYEPSNYAGAIVKFEPKRHMKRVTVNIFSSGSIIITGAETLMEVAHAYRTINHMISKECHISRAEAKQDFGVTMGAPFEEWLRVLNVV